LLVNLLWSWKVIYKEERVNVMAETVEKPKRMISDEKTDLSECPSLKYFDHGLCFEVVNLMFLNSLDFFNSLA
jgi:hypothetical protein